jgi:hypothetical protein
VSTAAVAEIDGPIAGIWYEADTFPDSDELFDRPGGSALERADGEQRRRPDDCDDRAKFDLLADELADATLGLGSLRAATRHPAYEEILALGSKAVPFLLARVDDPVQAPLWMRLLGSLIGFPPMLTEGAISDAARAWRVWGRSQGYLAR